MCNGYNIIITVYLRQAFFNYFLFFQKTLDIVLFLYFYHLHHICGLFYCYFFINIVNFPTNIFLINSDLLIFYYDSFTSFPVICSGINSRHCTLFPALSNSFWIYSSSSVNLKQRFLQIERAFSFSSTKRILSKTITLFIFNDHSPSFR